VIRHMAGGFNILGYDDLQQSQQTQNIAIQNNLIYDISTSYSIPGHAAPGRLAIIGAGPKNITFDHNTVDNDGSSTVFIYGGATPTGVQITGFELTNNLLRANTYGVFGDTYGQGTVGLNHYAPNAIVLHNTFAGASAKLYPVGNDFPTLAQWFADFVGRSAGDYRLVPSSLSNSAGTDGKDLGVDFAELGDAMNGTATPPPPPPPPGGSTPYTGTPINLPGTVQFENYDAGGEGIAYHDTTSGNSGGVYRSNSVDIKASQDTGGGYLVGWTKGGEWLNYTVNVTAAGTYAIDVRVASAGAGGTFHIEVNGVNKTGTLTVPNTGAWTTWTTMTKTGVALSAGQQVVRVVLDTVGASGSVANFNWFAVR
jgi:Carbohydrate binding module (family 6)